METQLLGNGLKMRNRQRSVSLSEIMTILIAVHQKPSIVETGIDQL